MLGDDYPITKTVHETRGGLGDTAGYLPVNVTRFTGGYGRRTRLAARFRKLRRTVCGRGCPGWGSGVGQGLPPVGRSKLRTFMT